jgi:murein DD-endopeptidase MepM/ murein hydrolase activator NlpD
MKKYLSLIVVPHDDSNVRNFKISYGVVYGFLVLITLCVVTVLVVVGSYGRILVRAHEADRLARENARLVDRAAGIDSLRAELLRAQALGIQIKNMLGVGLTAEDSSLVANLTPAANSPAIPRSFETAEASVEDQKMMLRAIPSMWPLKGYVTREFRASVGDKTEQYHPGIDIAAKRNTPVQAAAEGVVTTSGWDETYGYLVVIDHGFGITTLYGHNSRNLVSVGDRVARGQTIAFLGSTGKSTAPHLHFEVRKNDVPVDPRKYLLN